MYRIPFILASAGIILLFNLGKDIQGAKMPLIAAAPPVLPAIRQIGPHTESVNHSIYAKVLYVSAQGSKTKADGSVKNPFSSPQAALAAIKNAGADQRYAVQVAEGTYEVHGLEMKSYVDIFGGFSAKDWQKRDIESCATIFDGAGHGPIVIGADQARLDGVYLTGGVHDGMGGAVLCEGVSPTFSNNVMTGNRTIHSDTIASETLHILGHVGAAIAVLEGAKPMIRNNLIAGNTTDVGDGGAIAVRDSAPRIVGNVILNNQTGLTDTTIYDGHVGSRSSNGAAISLTKSQAQVENNVIAVNRANYINDGGGIYMEHGDRSHVNGNWLVGNTTSDDGGAIYVRGLADDSKPDDPVFIQGNLFAGNQIFNEERQKFGLAEAIFLSKQGYGEIRGKTCLCISAPASASPIRRWLPRATCLSTTGNAGFTSTCAGRAWRAP